MKLTFFVKYNQEYIHQFNTRNKELQTYGDYIDAIIEDHFLMYSAYIKYLRKNHGVDIQLVIPNWEKLNDLWLAEQNKLRGEEEVYLQQIRAFQPDILFLNSNFEYYPALDRISKEINSTVACWISCPIPKGTDLSFIDRLFTLFPPYKDQFESKGIDVFLTQAGFDPDMNCQTESDRNYDVTFIGGIGGFHRKREEYLKYLIPKTGMKVWGYGYQSPNLIKRLIKNILNGFVYVKSFQGVAWGKEMFGVMEQSKIAFNCHGELAGEYSVNMRLFEATGCGAMLLTEENDSLNKFFVPGEEVVTYTSKEDALAKIKYYLEHEDERARIAKAGQERTLKDYSYEKLTRELYESLEKFVVSKYD